MDIRGCPNHAIDHQADDDMALHGSKEQPIPIKEPRLSQQIQWQYNRISEVLGLHHICTQSLLHLGSLYIDRVVARTTSGEHHVFYFDVTAKIQGDQAKMNETWEKMKGDPNLPPDLKQMIEEQKRKEDEKEEEKEEDGKT